MGQSSRQSAIRTDAVWNLKVWPRQSDIFKRCTKIKTQMNTARHTRIPLLFESTANIVDKRSRTVIRQAQWTPQFISVTRQRPCDVMSCPPYVQFPHSTAHLLVTPTYYLHRSFRGPTKKGVPNTFIWNWVIFIIKKQVACINLNKQSFEDSAFFLPLAKYVPQPSAETFG